MTCDLYYIFSQLGPSQTRKPGYVTCHVQNFVARISGWNPGSDPSSNPGSDPSSNPGSDPCSNPGSDPGSKFRYPR